MTADKMDPEVFKVSGMITSEIAYRIANAGVSDALEMANITAEASEKRLGYITSNAISQLPNLSIKEMEENLEFSQKKIDFFLNRDKNSIDSTIRLIQAENNETKTRFSKFITSLKESLIAKAEEEKNKLSEVLTFHLGGK
jgi:hypothetical protein